MTFIHDHPVLVCVALIVAVQAVGVWLGCKFRRAEFFKDPPPLPETQPVRCGCECGCFLRCVLEEELSARTCAFCLTGEHFCDHGTAFADECPDCDPFHNVINLDSRRGNAS
jgi:hypothetical protein